MPYICQKKLPLAPWMNAATRKLPGLQPLDREPIFICDEVYELQMRYREKLLKEKTKSVYINTFESNEPTSEILTFVKNQLKSNPKYRFRQNHILRPDKVSISLLEEDYLSTAARLVQEDLLVLERFGDRYILRAGVLCFPASWTLNQKIGKSLMSIHKPVTTYNQNISDRVEKILLNLKPNIPVWRANYLFYNSFELYHPKKEFEEKEDENKKGGLFMRVERQTLNKFSKSGNILFGIHTFVVPFRQLSKIQRTTLKNFSYN